LKYSLALLTAFALAAAPTGAPTSTPWTAQPPFGEPRGSSGRTPAGAEPPATLVALADPAPDFSYPSEGKRWLHLHDLLAQGPVLLVFATDDPQLVALQGERGRLLDLGVVPVAVLDRRSGAAASAARRLGLEYLVIADVQRVIASQFNMLDPDSRQTAPGWFVIDRTGRVRALNRSGLPSHGYARLAATALAIPSPDVTLPTHGR
jgi:peroxiredoxin